MRLLLIGSPTYRMAQRVASLDGLGWDTHVYPVSSPDYGVAAHPLLAGATFWDATGMEVDRPEREVFVRNAKPLRLRDWRTWGGRGPSAARTLSALIRHLQPDLVHSFQVQDAGLATLDAREYLRSARMPYWIHTSYGSGGLPTDQAGDPRSRTGRLMRTVDMHIADCSRFSDRGERLGYAGLRREVILSAADGTSLRSKLSAPGAPRLHDA